MLTNRADLRVWGNLIYFARLWCSLEGLPDQVRDVAAAAGPRTRLGSPSICEVATQVLSWPCSTA